MNRPNPQIHSTDCASEPIAWPEAIQSFGFLFALSPQWIIIRTSLNANSFFNASISKLLGANVEKLFSVSAIHDIRNRLAVLQPNGTERLFNCILTNDGRRYDMALHYVKDVLVIEGEPSLADNSLDAASLVRTMVARLALTSDLKSFHMEAARQTRAITGFDRVMIYRFNENGAGEVIAESLVSGLESYLGLHYPASDIPAQARALYLQNPFRIIADVDSNTVKLLPSASGLVERLDLSLAITRAVSPIHVQYLKNMGVAASLSISIIVKGELWGLIACHNSTALLPSFVSRTSAELFGHMFSMKLEGRLREIEVSTYKQNQTNLELIAEALRENHLLLKDTAWLFAQISKMVQCDGIAVCLQGEMDTCGVTPSQSTVRWIVNYLRNTEAARIFETSELSSLSPDFPESPPKCHGLMAICISRSAKDYILLFRQEYVSQIDWGGDPSKSVMIKNDGANLSPRKSFEAFTTMQKGTSRTFSTDDCHVAEKIRSKVLESILRYTEKVNEERKGGTDGHELLVAELNHRVRNILALIRGLIYQSGDQVNDDVASYVASLSGRVQSLARAHDLVTRLTWGPASFWSLFESEISAYFPHSRERISLLGPDVMLHPQAFTAMALVVHELVTNSMKYGAMSTTGNVVVTIRRADDEGIQVTWIESGGPLVTAPTRRGFGTTIVERTVPFELGGTAEVQFLGNGLQAKYFIPEKHLVPLETGSPKPSSFNPLISSEEDVILIPLKNMNVLLIEDNIILALYAEDLLKQLGAKKVFTVSTVVTATQTIEIEDIDFAVLDINLGADNTLVFAKKISLLSIPFVFASGFDEPFNLDHSLSSVLTVKKPYDKEKLANAIMQTLDFSLLKPLPPKCLEI